MIRMPNDLLAQIDAYAETLEVQIGISDVSVSRAMAIRELCKKGLQSLRAAQQPVTPPVPVGHTNGIATPVTAPQSESPKETQQSEAYPYFDPAKYRLGKLCKRGHAWGTTGQSLLSIYNNGCKECKNESKRRKRMEKHQGQPA
jgi:hypothetical protein